MSEPHYKCLSEDEGVDEIRMKVVPRFKTSGLSGDEWRVSTVIEFYRKGALLHKRSFNSINAAAKYLPWVLGVELIENPEVPALWKMTAETCHQPGCPEKATHIYRIKKEFSAQGEGPLPDSVGENRRAFCERHHSRGDSDREDCDENYELVSGVPNNFVRPEDISPSAFGGVIEL